MPQTENTIKLEYPITAGAQLIQEITLRRPKVKDTLAVQKTGGNQAEQEIRLVANLACLTPTEVEELDAADYARVQEVLARFFSPKPRSSART
ncbi:MAG: phage tail assembly protein [Terracidiphilus sp.]|nr:phage tail assembly protein [Terracidiphilus sp.]